MSNLEAIGQALLKEAEAQVGECEAGSKAGRSSGRSMNKPLSSMNEVHTKTHP